MEQRFDFRNRNFVVHKPNLRVCCTENRDNMVEITNDYTIYINSNSSDAVLKAARDLQDYLYISMNVSVALKRADGINYDNSIVVLTDNKEATPGTFCIEVSKNRIVIHGCDDRGTIQGCYYAEDMMSFIKAPMLECTRTEISPSFSPRIVFLIFWALSLTWVDFLFLHL